MDKKQFMTELKVRLKRLPHDEYQEAINYYEEYLAESKNEAKAIEKLGTPEQVAAKIFADYAGKPANKVNPLVVLLTICSIPILLPVGISLFAAASAAAITIFALIISAFAIILTSVVGALLSFGLIGSEPLTTIFFIGYGMFGLSLGYFMFIGLWKLSKLIGTGFSRLGVKVLRRFAK